MTETPQQLTASPDFRPAGDPLDIVPQVLDLIRFSGAIFFRATFRSPWAYSSPANRELNAALPHAGAGSVVMFHVVAEGRCWAALEDGVRHELHAGDVVVMPYGDANCFGSTEPAEPVPIETLIPPLPWLELPHLRYGGYGDSTQIVCGYLRGDAMLFDPLLRALPPLFVVHPPDGPAATWVAACIEYAMLASRSAPGIAEAGRRLPELLFAEMLSLYLQNAAHVSGWLAALRDPVVGRALARLHADPAHEWTVAELARAVMVSRTVLADRFIQLLGRPPIRYLTEWRLQLAGGLLNTTDLGVGEIGGRVGYRSEEAFSRAFKRATGRSPARWRAGQN